MSLKHAIVGFLLERPMHGYQLKQALSPALGRDGQVNDGVLYPLLNRLVTDGLVRKRVASGEGGPRRHVLHPTKKGERWFRAWLDSDEGEADEVTYDFFVGHPFLAKCIFFSQLDRGAVERKLEKQLASAGEKLAAFGAIRAGMVKRRVDPDRIAVLDLGIAQQEQKMAWLKRRVSSNPRNEKAK